MKKILIAEDDNNINALLCELLQQNNYASTPAFSGTEALLHLQQNDFSLVLLDLMLPGKTGEDVLAEIRKNSSVPVIVLTARTDKETTTNLLRQGADDYITKPFDNSELLARIDVQLRRVTPSKPQLSHNGLSLDVNIFDAFLNDTKVNLSKREFEILQLMMSNPHKVFTKNNLYESVWGGDFLGDDNTINVHISKLRSKLHALAPGTEYIQTVWGIGFKMAD